MSKNIQSNNEQVIQVPKRELNPLILESSKKLKDRLENISRLQDFNESQTNSTDLILNYKLEDKIYPFLRSLTDLKHNLIKNYIGENIECFEKFEWFVKREDNIAEYNTINKFNEDFGMKLVSLKNNSGEKEIVFNNSPSVMFYEILVKPREVIDAGMEGNRYAGRARFNLDLNKDHEGKLMFYSDSIKLPREVKNIEGIPVGEFYAKSGFENKYRLAICVENENYLVEKNGSTIKSSHRFEKEKMADYNSSMRESLQKNPVVSRFRLMKFYYADEGKSKIQETKNFSWNSVHLEKEKFHTIPTKELNLELFIEKAEQLGIAIISEPVPHIGFDNAYDLKYKLV